MANPNEQVDVDAPATPFQTLLDSLPNNVALTDKVETIRGRIGRGGQRVTVVGDPADILYDATSLSSLLITEANGSQELTSQSVQIEYLKQDQRLLIPAPLAYTFPTTANSEVARNAVLVQRYLKVAGMTYDAIRDLVRTAASYDAIREQIDGIPDVAHEDATVHAPWIEGVRPTRAGNVQDRISVVTINYSTLSQALQLNCDIRDIGRLSQLDMRVLDNAWHEQRDAAQERLRIRMQPYTCQVLAALNFPGVNNNALAAWTRAYGVAAGVLPSPSSLSQIEYVYTYAMPAPASRQRVSEFEGSLEFSLYPVCMNIIAMFGLLHLSKDHTYKSTDPNMTRISTSYVMTLRTMVSTDMMDSMKGSLEPICRTAAHPFGLAAPYWLALVMHRLELLSSPLMLRYDVTPPPVQRIMIIRAATKEWESLASGQRMNELFADRLALIDQEYAKIARFPPAYSGLWRLYGMAAGRKVLPAVLEACNSIMPVIYGYSMALHTGEDAKKDGLALAMSFVNVARDHRVLSRTFESIWNAYLDNVSKSGLMEFVAESAKALGIAQPMA